MSLMWLVSIGPLSHVTQRIHGTTSAARFADISLAVTTVAWMPRDFDEDAHISRVLWWEQNLIGVPYRFVGQYPFATAELLIDRAGKGQEHKLKCENRRRHMQFWLLPFISEARYSFAAVVDQGGRVGDRKARR